ASTGNHMQADWRTLTDLTGLIRRRRVHWRFCGSPECSPARSTFPVSNPPRSLYVLIRRVSGMEILEDLDTFNKQREVEQNSGQSRSYVDRTNWPTQECLVSIPNSPWLKSSDDAVQD